jgi:hypothetical protein
MDGVCHPHHKQLGLSETGASVSDKLLGMEDLPFIVCT